jgi:hypothetical protein
MASWWKLVAQQLGVPGTGKGSWERRVAEHLGLSSSDLRQWAEKVARAQGLKGNVGSWSRRMIGTHAPFNTVTGLGNPLRAMLQGTSPGGDDSQTPVVISIPVLVDEFGNQIVTENFDYLTRSFA